MHDWIVTYFPFLSKKYCFSHRFFGLNSHNYFSICVFLSYGFYISCSHSYTYMQIYSFLELTKFCVLLVHCKIQYFTAFLLKMIIFLIFFTLSTNISAYGINIDIIMFKNWFYIQLINYIVIFWANLTCTVTHSLWYHIELWMEWIVVWL